MSCQLYHSRRGGTVYISGVFLYDCWSSSRREHLVNIKNKTAGHVKFSMVADTPWHQFWYSFSGASFQHFLMPGGLYALLKCHEAIDRWFTACALCTSRLIFHDWLLNNEEYLGLFCNKYSNVVDQRYL